jgi:hypothetical protein
MRDAADSARATLPARQGELRACLARNWVCNCARRPVVGLEAA